MREEGTGKLSDMKHYCPNCKHDLFGECDLQVECLQGNFGRYEGKQQSKLTTTQEG